LLSAIGELTRVASFRVIATVRALAGSATGCIVELDQLRDYCEDCGRGKLALVLKDGSEHLLTFKLYSADTLKALITPHATVVDLRVIDLFLSRFAPDAKWTGNLVNCLPDRQEGREQAKRDRGVSISPAGSTTAHTCSSSRNRSRWQPSTPLLTTRPQPS
jgi:hypothetical protein